MGSPLAMSPPSVLTGMRPVDLGGAVGDQLLLLAVGAEAVLGHVDHLGAGVGVLELDDVDVLGPDAGLLVGRLRRVHRRRARPARPRPTSACTSKAP